MGLLCLGVFLGTVGAVRGFHYVKRVLAFSRFDQGKAGQELCIANGWEPRVCPFNGFIYFERASRLQLLGISLWDLERVGVSDLYACRVDGTRLRKVQLGEGGLFVPPLSTRWMEFTVGPRLVLMEYCKAQSGADVFRAGLPSWGGGASSANFNEAHGIFRVEGPYRFRLLHADLMTRVGAGVPRAGEVVYTGWVSISPDASMMAVWGSRVRPRGGKVRFLRVYALGQTPPRTICDVEHAGWPVAWSPHGTGLAFVSAHGPRRNRSYWVELIDIRNGQRKALYRSEYQISGLDWSPDGRWLLLVCNYKAFAVNLSSARSTFITSCSGRIQCTPDMKFFVYERMGHIYLRHYTLR